jgi:NAD(P)H-hydrate epimerase
VKPLSGSQFQTEESDIRSILKPRAASAHKGDFGHALFIGGSYGKMGAAILATRACLRTGVGLLTAFIPSCGNQIMQTAVPEAMCISLYGSSICRRIGHLYASNHPDSTGKYISEINEDLSKYNAVGVGPGLGLNTATVHAIHNMLNSAHRPMVIDADALNIISANPEMLPAIPENSILTPHAKEFERLSGVPCTDRQQQTESAAAFAVKHNIFVVLKGANTVIACPNGDRYINPTGNPYMATAGSGDVLCGIILSLLAQGYTPLQSALAGVFLHGRAGDLAAAERTPLIASDIVECIKFTTA